MFTVSGEHLTTNNTVSIITDHFNIIVKIKINFGYSYFGISFKLVYSVKICFTPYTVYI